MSHASRFVPQQSSTSTLNTFRLSYVFLKELQELFFVPSWNGFQVVKSLTSKM